MTSDSPYQPPAVHPPPLTPPSPASSPRPTVVMVFGILHLVLAAYGVFGFAMLLVQPFFMNMLGRGNPALKKQMDLQAAYQWWMYVSAGISMVLAVILIVAGIKLLKSRPNALRWSNGYSFTSILLKILSVGVTLRFVAPAMRAAMQDNPMPAFFVSNAWYVLCGVLAMIYPLLALILLNQPRVKQWFDRSAL